jgi:long-chain acyl-CoA synthetase
MPSALDASLDRAINVVLGPGGPFKVETLEKDGVSLPWIANAPPSLAHYFAHFCGQHGDATFLVEGEERVSFVETYAHALAFATALVSQHGVKRGDRVGLAMRNANAWVVAYMGIIMAGGCATLLNGWWQSSELAAGVAATETGLVIADPQRAARLAEASELHSARIITLDITQPLAEAIVPVTGGSAGDNTVLPALNGDDLATILFTSGSTGQSKGAYSRHLNVLQGIFNYLVQTSTIVMLLTEAGQMGTDQPATLISTPLFHVTAEVPVFLQSFAMGRRLVLMPKWDAENAMMLIEREKVNYFVGVPLMSYEILVHPNRGKYDLSCCKSFAAGGAPRPPEHVKRLVDGMGGGMPLLGYGLTETNAVGCGNINENYLSKPTSTGPASRPLVDLAIKDEAGNSMPQGSVGEVSIRSIANFEGYWNNPEATRAAFTADRYFRTGDLGYLDEDGYLFIVDRKKDIIIRGGENISCQEVEAALYAHADVAESCVFGLHDDRLGEVPGAAVYCHPGTDPGEAALRDFVGTQLAAFKVPVRIWVHTEALPKLGTEKIDKVTLRAQYRKLMETEQA